MATYQIGRDFDKPIKIDEKHSSVSHNHATINIDGDNWTLTDNNSTNGTFIEDGGVFRRCQHVKITPNTWIRLGQEGHKGFTFKARRVLRPNDYSEDFAELNEILREVNEAKQKLQRQKNLVRYLMSFLPIACFFLSFQIPALDQSPRASRFFIMLPGAAAPFLSSLFVKGAESRVKELEAELKCPKCRRTLSTYDIKNRACTICKAC